MILNSTQIIKSNQNGSISIKPFDEQSVRPASYDLRVGDEAVTTSSEGRIDVKTKRGFDLNPGEFAMVLTLEKLAFDRKHCARPDMRTHYTRRGIMPAAGPQVDPGFKGRLKIGLTNFSTEPVHFKYKARLMTIEIHELQEAAPEAYSGRNQGIDGFTDEEVDRISHGEDTGLGGIMKRSRGLSKRVSDIERIVTKTGFDVENTASALTLVRWAVAVCISVVGLIAAAVGLGMVVVFQLGDVLKDQDTEQACRGETTNIACRVLDASPAIATEQNSGGAMNLPPTSPETPQPEGPAPTTKP